MADDLDAYERGFRRAGLPLFIEDHTAREDVWTRAAPVLALVLLGEVLGAIDLDWSPLANLGALAGGLAIVLGVAGLVNRLRGRPWRSLPEDVGPPELVAFVVVPALLPAVFGGQLTSALVTAGVNLVLLLVLYGVIAYGLASIVAWAGRRVVGQLAGSAQLVARAVPLLLLFAVVVFVNTEMWQVFADMPDGRVAGVVAMFGGIATLFAVARVPREVALMEAEVGEGPPLRRRQRSNVGLVLLVSQALQVLVVSAAIGAFFTAFGVLAIDADVVDTWLGHRPDAVFDVGGVVLYAELLRVAAVIAAFSGLYYAIAVLTDGTYREEFLSELTDAMRESFTARARYLRLRGEPAA